MSGGTAPLGIIMVAGAGFIGFEALKHFQTSKSDGKSNTSGSSGSSGVPTHQASAVAPTGSVLQDARAYAQLNGVSAAPILAIAQFESGLNPAAMNPDCKGNGSYDTVCRGYLQVNENVYGPAPDSLAGQLAIPGIGPRIVAAIRKYGNDWSTNFLAFWAEAQGGTSNGNPSDLQRAQQAVAFGLQNA